MTGRQPNSTSDASVPQIEAVRLSNIRLPANFDTETKAPTLPSRIKMISFGRFGKRPGTAGAEGTHLRADYSPWQNRPSWDSGTKGINLNFWIWILHSDGLIYGRGLGGFLLSFLFDIISCGIMWDLWDRIHGVGCTWCSGFHMILIYYYQLAHIYALELNYEYIFLTFYIRFIQKLELGVNAESWLKSQC